MEVLKFNVDQDRRNLVSDKQEFKVDFKKSPSWIQARQYENQMRQVQVRVVHGDNSPFDLTDVTPMLEGWMPDGTHRIIDNKHGVLLDPQNGVFRFDFPAPVFAVAGSYKQIFFRLWRHGKNIATLEFSMEVLADKVIDGLIPRDYVTPFEDIYDKMMVIYKNADDKFKVQINAWQQQVTKLLTGLNGNYASMQTTVTSLNTQLSALADKIKANGLLTQSDFSPLQQEIEQARRTADGKVYQTIGKRLDNMPTKADLDINLAADSVISGEVSDEDKANLYAIKKSLDPSKFNLLFLTDAHYGKWGSAPERANNTSIHHLANALYLDDSVDVIVAGGDNIDGWTDSLAGLLNEHNEFARELLFGGGNHADRFTLKGNHDDGSGRVLQYIEGDYDYIKWRDGALGYSAAMPTVISDDQLKQLYHTGDLLFDEKRVADSLYFYKDYPDKKVRLIGLDSNDGPEVLDEKGLPKYLDIHHMGYQQAQIDWLANTALMGVPDDYVVMVVGHIPASAAGSDQNNQTIINQILNAFQSGQAVHVMSTDVDWPVDVSADYSAQGSRTVVAYVNGHLHQEYLTQDLGFPSVSVTSSINDGVDGTPYDGKTNIDGWDVISIDRDNARINITGFGRAKNRSAQYVIAGGTSE